MTDQSAALSHSFYADCAIFAKVARTLSYKRAGDALGLSRSAVSKHVSELEQYLGVVLLNRSTRRMSVTDAGMALLTDWRQIEKTAVASFEAIHGSDLTPSGNLKISMASSLGALLMPCLADVFMKEWPAVRISLHLSEMLVDIVGKGFDVVIRIAERLDDSVLTATRLMTTQRIFVASPGYLQESGHPETIESLKDHRTLSLGTGSERSISWRYSTNGQSHEIGLVPTFLANNDLSLVLAACLDKGIMYVPKFLIQSEIDRGRLVQIDIKDVAGPELGIFAVYPHREPPAKVRVFVEFVKKHLVDLNTPDRWQPLVR